MLSCNWPITGQPPLVIVSYLCALQRRATAPRAIRVLAYFYRCHDYTNCVVGADSPGVCGIVRETSGISGISGSPPVLPPPNNFWIPAQIPPKTPAAPAIP